MSRHHMLPPTIYIPAPRKPEKTRRRRGAGYVKGKDALKEADETAQTGEVWTAAPARGAAAPPSRSIPDEGETAEQRLHRNNHNISHDTLTALFELQQHKGPQGAGGAAYSEDE